MNRNALLMLLACMAVWLGPSAPGRGATTATLAAIQRAIAYGDSQHEIGDGERLQLQRMLAFAVDKDAAGLVRYGKECGADLHPRLRLCQSWCLYLAEPAKYASQFVETFPIDFDAPDDAYHILYGEFGFSQYAEGGLLPDPFVCLGQIAVSGDKKAIEKLLLLFSGNGAEDTMTMLSCRYRTLQKWPEETIRIAGRLFEAGKQADVLGDPSEYSQEELDRLKAKLRPMLSQASPAERAIIESVLEFYVQDVPGPALDDVAGFTPPPYKLALADGQKWRLGEMLKSADAKDEAGLEKCWIAMDELWRQNRSLVLAHQWYLYTIAPEKWRDAFVEKFPTDPAGVSDCYRVAHAYCPQASAGSAVADLGKIAEEGNVRAIDQLGAARCFGPPGGEVEKSFFLVLERQPAKTLRSIAAAIEKRGSAYASPDSAFRALGGKRFVALREQLQKLEPNATEREKRVLRGFMTYSTVGWSLPSEDIVTPLEPKP